ncbi:MAG: nucleoside-diphosphate kinase [Spirochaetales bacterium]|nr:nucleoside-diphosphate kinase [Spirochaetales bacterium]
MDDRNADVEQTLVLIKPDGLKRSLTGNIIALLSHPDNMIVAVKLVKVTRELAEKHYSHLKHKPFYEDLIRFLLGEWHTNRVMALVYEGPNIIQRIREISGATNPEEAKPDSIRGKYGRIHSKTGVYENVIHCSANDIDAEKEIKLWFEPYEIVNIRFPVQYVVEERTVMRWKT